MPPTLYNPGAMPNVVVIAGPNGAGKSTAAPTILRDLVGIGSFVNADDIARGLSGFDPEAAAVQAGRVMLLRLRELAAQRADFAFETTLASRSFAPWLADLVESGYSFHLVYLWVASPLLSIGRVADRVRAGGHFVPDDVVRRRYVAGLRNFFSLYQPLAETWSLYDNSDRGGRRLVAEGGRGLPQIVYDDDVWTLIQGGLTDATR